MIYLDYAANTPASQEVLDYYCEVSRNYMANPNSAHRLGKTAKECLDSASEKIIELLNLKEAEVIFTSGATESNNLAIKGVAEKYKNYGKHIISTYLEHSSVNGALAFLQSEGFEIDYVDLNSDGQISIDHLKELIKKDTVLVSVCYVDSEAGIIQPIEEIARILSSFPNCRFHVDATQAVSKIPLRLENVDLITFSPHKFYGLNGSGILIKKEALQLTPQIHGGISTTPYRSGTPALGLAAAAAKALELAALNIDDKLNYVKGLNLKLRNSLSWYPAVKINSPVEAVPFIINISLPGVKTEEFREELEKSDIYISNRSACCAPNSVSRPIFAVTKDRKRAMSTLRISLSHLTTEVELDEFLKSFDECYKKFVK